MKILTIPIFSLILIIIISVFAILPLFHPGFFPMHDDTQVARVYEMAKSLKSGIFPVRLVSDLGYGYGYPIFNFYAPFAYYIGALFVLFGFNALVATKIMIGAAFILSGVGMYFLARSLFNNLAGIVAGAAYVFAPYHAIDLYVRGDISELYAYAIIPFAFFYFYKLILSTMEKKDILKTSQNPILLLSAAAISFSLIIISHNLTALLITPFLMAWIIFWVFQNLNKKSVYLSIFALLFGIILSAFYVIPTFAEMKYTNVLSVVGGGSDFHDHFVCPSQLWNSPWGFGGSTHGCVDGISFRLGKVQVIFSIFATLGVFLLLLKKKHKQELLSIGFSITLLVVAIFLMLPISQPIWELIKPMAFLQFPWRFLLATSFFMSILLGSTVWMASLIFPRYKINIIAMVIIIALITFYSVKLFVPQIYLDRSSLDFTNEYTLKWTTSKISDEYMPKNFIKPNHPSEIVKNTFLIKAGKGQISSSYNNETKKTSIIENTTPITVLAKIAYFPSWHLFVDFREKPYTILNNGLQFSLPPGRHSVLFSNSQTNTERVANIISLVGIIILFLGIIKNKIKNLYGHKG